MSPLRAAKRLRQWGTSLAVTVVVIAVVTVVSWSIGQWRWLSFGEELVPIAPSTALALLLLSLAALIGVHKWEKPALQSQRLEGVLAGMALLLIGAVVLHAQFDVGPDLEAWLSSTETALGQVPLGRMSMATATLLVGLSAAILMRCVGSPRLSTLLFTVASGAAFVFLQGYLFGAPLLYDGQSIPVSLLTALSTLLVGLAGLLGGRRDEWPVRLFIPEEIPTPELRRAFLYIAGTLGSIVVASAAFWFVGQRSRAEQARLNVLTTVVELKANEVSAWYEGHLSTARGLQAVPVSTRMMDELRRATSADAAGVAAQSWLSSIIEERDFVAAAVFDLDGRLMAAAAEPGADRAGLQTFGRRVPPLGQVPRPVPEDIEAHGAHSHLLIWIPVREQSGATTRVTAWLLLSVDVTLSLFPILQEFPLDAKSGEFVLWRIRGDTAEALTPGRRPSTASGPVLLPVRRSSPTVIVRAWFGGDGNYAGVDYRGADVVASVRRVPRTSWILVAKLDRIEVIAPATRAAVIVALISLILLGTISAILFALWSRRNQAQTSRELSLIRAREHSVEELRQSEARYARAMRGTSDGLWDRNLVAGTTYVSPRWREIMGVSPETPIENAEDMLSVVLPEDATRQREAVARHLADGTPYDIELRIHRADGEIRWIRTRGEAERDANGRAIRMAGAIADVTEQHLAEAALARVDRILRMRSAVDQAMIRATTEQELLRAVCDTGVSAGGYPMAWIGYKQDDATRSVRPMAVAGDALDYLSRYPVSWDAELPNGNGPTGRCIRSGEVQAAQNLQGEDRFSAWRDAASARSFRSSISIPIRAGKSVIGALTFYSAEANAFDAEEISLLTELGQDLSFGISSLRDHALLNLQREQLTLFRQVIEQSSDAIIVTDAATGEFVDFNAAALKELGYTAEELARLHVNDVVVGDQSPFAVPDLVATVRENDGAAVRSDYRRKDGTVVPTEVAMSVVELGQRTLILGIARDITDRLRAEEEREALQEQLTRSQKLESIGRLAGGIAHDFNNLLTVINATTDLSLNELPDGSPMRMELGQIRAAGERAKALTRQLLAFSRQQVLKREVLDLNAVAQGFITMLRRVIGEHIHLQLELSDDIPAVIADAGQLEQVLMNLCVNARDAMPNGGTLTIATSRVDRESASVSLPGSVLPGSYAQLTVSDTGTGMDEATLAKVFDPFFTTKAVGQGTGLGLSTVYGIVAQSGGICEIESAVGRGTTVRISLPSTRVTITPVETQAAAPITKASGHETILVVEDEAAIRFVARRVLEQAGYTVLQAASGTEALAQLEAHGAEISLVMTDLVMPGMTGLELAREVRRTRPTLKVLLASGYSADASEDNFLEDEGWNFIAKPYGVQELVIEVRRVLDS